MKFSTKLKQLADELHEVANTIGRYFNIVIYDDCISIEFEDRWGNYINSSYDFDYELFDGEYDLAAEMDKQDKDYIAWKEEIKLNEQKKFEEIEKMEYERLKKKYE